MDISEHLCLLMYVLPCGAELTMNQEDNGYDQETTKTITRNEPADVYRQCPPFYHRTAVLNTRGAKPGWSLAVGRTRDVCIELRDAGGLL